MNRVIVLWLFLGMSGCATCGQNDNPVSPDYPCGTRAHACSVNPLMCCWNSSVCGGQVGSGCQEGFCCYAGEDYAAKTDAGSTHEKQWKP